jgi:hypothetical protein
MSFASYYPSSAYVINRLLPFKVVGASDIFIKSVHLKSGDSCQIFIDPYHEKDFHIYCLKPSLVTAEIMVSDKANNNYTLSLGYINIFEESLPGQSVAPTFKTNEAEK